MIKSTHLKWSPSGLKYSLFSGSICIFNFYWIFLKMTTKDEYKEAGIADTVAVLSSGATPLLGDLLHPGDLVCKVRSKEPEYFPISYDRKVAG